MKSLIPNSFTLGNLVCGVLAIRAIVAEQTELALMLVAIAAFLDFFDGMLARLLGVSGELGKQLDSLADNVTFGVVPGFMGLSMAGFLHANPSTFFQWILFTACLLVPAMATLRLAKFNIDENQSQGFVGMPTPANTLFVASLFFVFYNQDGAMATALQNPYLLLPIILLSAIWQILPVPLLALKFKNTSWKQNQTRYIFVVIAAALFVAFSWPGIAGIVVFYFFYSWLTHAASKKSNS